MVLLLFALLAAAVAVMNVRGDRRSRRHIDRWAEDNGMQVDRVRYRRWALVGPVDLRRGSVQRLFEVSVRDADGRPRTGLVRVGGLFLGSLSDRVDVRWDDD